jgi:hypothetical protein
MRKPPSAARRSLRRHPPLARFRASLAKQRLGLLARFVALRDRLLSGGVKLHESCFQALEALGVVVSFSGRHGTLRNSRSIRYRGARPSTIGGSPQLKLTEQISERTPGLSDVEQRMSLRRYSMAEFERDIDAAGTRRWMIDQPLPTSIG